MVYTGLKIGLLTSGIVGAGAFYKLILTQPKNIAEKLTKQGYELPAKDSDWNILLEENTEELKKELNSQINLESNKLKGFCEDLYKKSPEDINSLNKAEKYCVYFPKTIKGIILKSGFNKLLNENSDEKKWKVAFNIYRYLSEFNNLLKDTTDKTLSWALDTDTGTPILKTWCKSTLKKEWKSNKDNIYNAQKYCSDPGVATIEDLINIEEPRWELATNWEENVKIWKDTGTVIRKIGDSNVTQENLKKWCEAHIKDALDENDSYAETYRVVRDGCRKL